MRNPIRTLHLILALIAGLLLSVVTVSGSLAQFRPEIDRLHAAPPAPAIAEPGGSERVHLDAVAARLSADHADARVTGLLVPEGAGLHEWTLRTSRDRAPDARVWKVYTDPATGDVLGSTRDSTVSAVLAWIGRFHHDLWWKPVGGILVGSAGLALIGFIITGWWLWWPGWRAIGRSLTPRWRAGGLARHASVHRMLGVVAMPTFLLIAITGAMFAFPWMKSLVHAGLGGSAADLPVNLRAKEARPRSVIPIGEAAGGIGWTRAVDAAEAAAPGTRLLVASPPRDPDGVWRVVLTFPGNISPVGGVVVGVDRHSGAIRGLDDPRAMSVGGWTLNQHWGLHLGSFGGVATRVLWLMVGLLPPVLLITGAGIWWHRRRGVSPGGRRS